MANSEYKSVRENSISPVQNTMSTKKISVDEIQLKSLIGINIHITYNNNKSFTNYTSIMNIKINHVIFKLRYAIKTYDIYIYNRQYNT